MKALILEQQDHYKASLSSRATEIERLKMLVDKLQRMLFGAKSEKVLRQIEQLELQLEELGAAEAVEEKRAIATAERPVPAKPFRRPLPRPIRRRLPSGSPTRPTGAVSTRKDI